MMNPKQYGPTLLIKKVATKADLNTIVLCVPKLPDATEVVDGSVMQLVQSQRGYAATHFYKAVDGAWVHVISDYGPQDNVCNKEATYEYETVQDTDETYYTGYLLLYWDQADDNELAGELIHELVVRKLDEYPTHPDDGQLIVRAPKGEVTHSYKYFDEVVDEDTIDRYKYTVFHVFASGWWSRTDIQQ
jgi:hypothetical protein